MLRKITTKTELIDLLTEQHDLYGGFVFSISPLTESIEYEEIYSKDSYTIREWMGYKSKIKENWCIPYMTVFTSNGTYKIDNVTGKFSEYLQNLR